MSKESVKKACDRCIEQIHAMNTIILSLNDEDLLDLWLSEGVPDGCYALDDIKDLFGWCAPSEIFEETERMSKVFARIMKSALKENEWYFLGFSKKESGGYECY